ncbi:16S rRNA (guanine1207-N2)-methyltransferase [Breoghania corrubedonensis]|uniref:16S rRNA (Guanine1207-N2)-methyltransferase n=1 Tax=Breoghania corrubedonensis TaxID=665038 RepID=A0A2T5V4S7_9HYPH|nr:class I SAM-dependent methyltransferase [Breoghania corrubedonensis]PTW58758.1 16S rRNA (guanine1207-N2)-methyltransferase [Breoghania corrubedonensis]
MTTGLYGAPSRELVDIPADALQLSPLVPGARVAETLNDTSLDALIMLAPPGTDERAFAMAHGLRALKPGAPFTILAPKDKGGSRLAKELAAFGLDAEQTSKHHHRICTGERPAELHNLDEAIARGAPRLDEALGLWTQPGIFSWNRLDPGSAALVDVLPQLSGKGADFGAGLGILSARVLTSPSVTSLDLYDLDHRAVEAARRNIADPRAHFHWADVRTAPIAGDLDFVVMNPPFHEAGSENRALGQTFIRRAAGALRKGGVLWLTANRHLPYEAPLREVFARVEPRGEVAGFKLFEARK